jgi:Cyclin, N-terminal domain
MGHAESRDEISFIYQDLPIGDSEVPSQADVILFYKDFYQRSQMEHDTIIMSLIYVERLIKATSGVIAPVPENWRSILFSCMVLASKVWDDLSMWNVDFSNVCGRDRTQLSTFTLGRINQLELALLKSLNFNVKVPASEYAKYYFLIRGMLMKSGLLNEQDRLDGKGAKNLEKLTSDYHETAKTSIPQSNVHRISQSMGDYKWLNPNDDDSGPIHSSICLEHVVVSMKG